MGKIDVIHDVDGIEGLCIVEPQIFEDNRGYLYEAYSNMDFVDNGLSAKFVQDNEAFSKKGVLRGFGVNIKEPQSKLIRVISGKIFDVVIDLRPNSRTFMKHFCIELSSKNKKQLYIPEGFGHAYIALEDSDVLFKVSSHYIPGAEIGFAWDSRAFDISWPFSRDVIILSDRDKDNPEFDVSMVV